MVSFPYAMKFFRQDKGQDASKIGGPECLTIVADLQIMKSACDRFVLKLDIRTDKFTGKAAVGRFGRKSDLQQQQN